MEVDLRARELLISREPDVYAVLVLAEDLEERTRRRMKDSVSRIDNHEKSQAMLKNQKPKDFQGPSYQSSW